MHRPDTEDGITIISGEIVQISASISQGDVENSNTSRMYPFIMIKSDDGEVIKINNLIADAHIEQHLFLGKKVTFYLKQVRHLTNFKTMNCAVAATSDAGTGIMDLPAQVVRALYIQAIIVGLLVGAIASFLLTTVIGGIFHYVGSALAMITGLYFLEGLVFVGGLIGFLSGPALLIYLLRSAGRFADIRKTAERLRGKLTDSYRGTAVRNI
ncbi:hypothetical protein OIV19_22640 [Brucella sp. HL-2]|nr:hypothetical protein [Brucella sp. HL-2]MCV9910386.1 hypothetical protein [Brucella sp. HL-2]